MLFPPIPQEPIARDGLSDGLRGSELLTELKLRRLTPSDGLVSVGGVPGLYYKAATVGRGKWVLRFVSPMTSKRRDMGLGTYPEVTLSLARKAALMERERINQGDDPLEHKRQLERTAALSVKDPTFAEAARKVHEEVKSGFRNQKHAEQWLTSLETYVFPLLGERLVSSLRASDFADALRPIWLPKAETASRLKQRCAAVMDWSVAHGFLPASPVGVVSKLLAKQPGKATRVIHQPAAPWQSIPTIVSQLCHVERPSVSRRALEILILTGCRSGEVRGMEWSEIDFTEKIWTIPGIRMKAKQTHRVPLCDRAMEMLETWRHLKLHPKLVFPSSRGTQLSDMTLTKLLRDKRVYSSEPGRYATAHGFRSSFRDWASEHGYARDLAERALAHTIKNQTEKAYHRTDLLEQRRTMMQEWSFFAQSARTIL
jgi:integrase